MGIRIATTSPFSRPNDRRPWTTWLHDAEQLPGGVLSVIGLHEGDPPGIGGGNVPKTELTHKSSFKHAVRCRTTDQA